MHVLGRIIRMTWQHRTRLFFAYVSFFAAVGFSLLVPKLFGHSIDRLVHLDPVNGSVAPLDVELGTLALMALALLGANLMRGLGEFARSYTGDALAQHVSFELRHQIYDKLQHLSFAFHDREHTGNLMSKATADVDSVRRFVNMGLVRSLDVVVRLTAITCILLFLNWQLALISLAFVPFSIVQSTIVLRHLREMWRRAQSLMGDAATIVQENLVGIQVVRAFAAESHEQRKFDRKAVDLRQSYLTAERLQGANTAWMAFYSTLTLGFILWFGGREVIQGDLTAGGLTQFILYMNQLHFPIRAASRVINSFSRATSAGERIFALLDARSPVEEQPGAIELERVRGHVCYHDVSFSYESRLPALSHIQIEAQPGQMIAITGAPGSGKSTIVNLLPRFYDPTGGRICIDGIDVRDMTLHALRGHIGIVQQDVFLFSATIRDNIAYGVMDASLEAVIQAAKTAHLHDQIMQFPDGYDTWVGERGVTLSGGQKQRLSIARTLLRDPPILILDDATSSVDVETESLIQAAMTDAIDGRTTFVIAHRLSTLRRADLILVLQHGEIVARGTHAELLAQPGIYQELYALQLRPQGALYPDHSSPNALLNTTTSKNQRNIR